MDPKTTATSSPCVRTYEFSFRLDSNNGLQPPTNLGEIFVLHSPSWKQECCLGIIGSNDINSTFLADQKVYDDDDSKDLFKLWVCVCGDPLDETGWLPETDMVRFLNCKVASRNLEVLSLITIILTIIFP